MNKKGVITVKVLLMMMSVILIFTILVASLQKGFKRNNDYRNKVILGDSVLASYDTYLYVNYGLYGYSSIEQVGYMKHNMFDNEIYEIIPNRNLTDIKIMEAQILDFMTYRMPVNYMDQLLERLDIIKSSAETSKVLDHKKVVDVALSDLDHLYTKKDLLALQVNGLNHEVISSLSDEDLEIVIDVLEDYLSYNYDLRDFVIKLSRESDKVDTLIDETIELIEGNKTCIEIVKNQVIESLDATREELHSGQGDVYLEEDFLTYIRSFQISPSWYPLLYDLYCNINLLEKVVADLKVLEEGEQLANTMDILYNYRFIAVLEDGQGTYKSYYENELSKQENRGRIEVSGMTCQDTLHQAKEKADFWSLISYSLSSAMDELAINEYILSTFTSFSEPSHTDYDYFNKYERTHFFKTGEIEYILMGHHQEALNISQTYGVIFGVRTIMNGLHIYTDKEKLDLSETIGMSIAGWTGFGGPLVSNLIRVAWASGESVYDMNHLLKGESVAFYKFYANQWHYDLGIVYEKEDIPEYLKFIDLTYHDYLRLMLLTLKSETKLKRIANLIELDLNNHNKTLKDLYTEVVIDDFTKAYQE